MWVTKTFNICQKKIVW